MSNKKAKVIERFFDKYTGREYKKGDIVNVTESRFNELNSKKKLVEAVVETKKEK